MIKQLKNKIFGKPNNEISIQDLIPIDVEQNCIQFKDEYLISGVKIEPFNFFLLSSEEKRQKKIKLNDVFSTINEEFKIFVIERPINLNAYINHLEQKKSQTTDLMKKKSLNSYIRFSSSFASSYDCIEKLFFVMIFQNISSKINKDRQEIIKRVEELNDNFKNAGFFSKVCNDEDLSKLNMMFFNPIQTMYEVEEIDFEMYHTTIMREGEFDETNG